MIIVLPPSETKISGGSPGSKVSLDGLSFPCQNLVRKELITQLVNLASDEQASLKTLKLGPRGRSEVDRNRQIWGTPVTSAISRYSGVLYDSLSVPTLSSDARLWAEGRVAIFSALFGLIRSVDKIPAYRLSCSTVLAGGSVKSQWEPISANIWSEVEDFVLDLRSEGYRELAPVPPGMGVQISFVTQKGDGRKKALGHFNKAAKGSLVRQLVNSRPTINSIADLISWGEKNEVAFDTPPNGSDMLELAVREN